MYKEKLKDTPKEVLNWRLWYGVLGELGPPSTPINPQSEQVDLVY